MVKGGTFTVPTDWSVWVVYNPSILPGVIKLKSWVEDFTKEDIQIIKNEWQPTGTAYIDYDKLKKEEQRKKQEIEELLKKKLLEAKEEANKLIKQAEEAEEEKQRL